MRRKGLKRKLSNIVLLVVLLAIVLGIYYNVYNSRAEDVLEIVAVALDNYGYLDNEEFKLEAKPAGDNMYEIELPESINSKKINQIHNVTLEKLVDTNQEAEQVTEQNQTVVENVDTDTEENGIEAEETEIPNKENSELEQEIETTTQENEVPAEETETTTQENEVPAEKTETTTQEEETSTIEEQTTAQKTENTTENEQETTESEVSAEQEQNVENTTQKIEVTDNKITLSKEQIDNNKIILEISYDIAIIKTTEEGEIQKESLAGTTEEQRQQIGITEETKMLYSKVLKYEDEEKGKLVEVKGFLPKDAQLKVEEVTQEKLTEIFGEAQIDVAYDIKIVIEVEKTVPVDETNPTGETKTIIETVEINPEDFGESCEVSIKDSKILADSKVYHVKDDNTYEPVNVKESLEESISFNAQTFSVYAVSADAGISTASINSTYFTVSPESNTTWEQSQTATISDDYTRQNYWYAWTTDGREPTSESAYTYLGPADNITKNTGTGKYYLHVRMMIATTSVLFSNSWYCGYTGPYYIDNTAPATPTVSANQGWTNAAKVKYTLSGGADGSGQSGRSHYYWQYSHDSSQAGALSGSTATFSAEQNRTVYFYSVDNAGNYSSKVSRNIKIDRTVPTISSVATDELKATITATDDRSGVATYSFDGGSTWQTSNTYTYSAAGTYNVYVKDNAGNISEAKSVTVGPSDTTPPTGTTTVNVEATNQDTITVYATVADEAGGSGIGKILILGWYGTTWVSTDTSGTVQYDSANDRYYATFSFADIKDTTTGNTNNGEGTYTFKTHVYDNAGNRKITNGVSVVYDATAPTITANPSSSTTPTSEKTITITAADAGGSGLSSSNTYKYYLSTSSTNLSNGYWATYTSGTAFTRGAELNGTYYLFVKEISDVAQNTSAANGTLVTIYSETYQRFGPYIFANDTLIITGEATGVTDGLIRHYDGTNNLGNGHSNETTTWKDLSGNYDGIINGAIVGNNHVSFDGVDDYANLGEITGLETVTLEASISLNSIQEKAVYILDNLNLGGTGLYLYYGCPGFVAHIGGEYVYLKMDEPLDPAIVNNISGTYDGNYMRLYVNGILHAETAVSGTIDDPTENTVMAMGTNPANDVGTQEYSNVKIYSARIYDRALSQNEIKQNLNADRINVAAANNDSVTLSFIFATDRIDGFEENDITVENGTKGTLTYVLEEGSKTVYTLDITDIPENATLEVSVPAGAYRDTNNLAGTAANTSRYRDTTGPQISSITSTEGTTATTYNIQFNESVLGLTTDDITITNGTIQTISKVSGTQYNVVVSDTGTGNQNLTIREGAVFDLAGNTNEKIVSDQSSPNLIITGEATGVTDGLIRHYDGTNNVGNGHSSSTTIWKDLSGNYDAEIIGPTVEKNNVSFDGVDAKIDIGHFEISNNMTVETSIKMNELTSEYRRYGSLE